jgi:trehalose 6-phosphate synthase
LLRSWFKEYAPWPCASFDACAKAGRIDANPRAGVVTPLRDGMNLVAKEYVAAQNPDDPGVLVLSQFAGAAAELRAALLVNPNDPEAVSQAIQHALTMPLDERRARHEQLMKALYRTDISKWGTSFIAKLTSSNGLDRPEILAAE